ncbi:MAG: hypothetical protein ABW034_21385 [Steroidobacteraceae bacterium]
MNSMTPDQARDYLERWRLIKQAEVEALRASSMETKLQQLSVLVASRNLFADRPERDGQVREIRDRWARIRQALGG